MEGGLQAQGRATAGPAETKWLGSTSGRLLGVSGITAHPPGLLGCLVGQSVLFSRGSAASHGCERLVVLRFGGHVSITPLVGEVWTFWSNVSSHFRLDGESYYNRSCSKRNMPL
jgi:hypothetical protein